MNTNNRESSRATVVPYQWWVAGVDGSCIYVSCVSTARRGVIEDASPTELSCAQCVDITSKSCLTISEVSYPWGDAARVRVIDEPDKRGPNAVLGPSALVRDILIRMLRSDLRSLPLEGRPEGRRAAIEALDGLIQRLDRWEFIQWFEDHKKGYEADHDDDCPF